MEIKAQLLYYSCCIAIFIFVFIKILTRKNGGDR